MDGGRNGLLCALYQQRKRLFGVNCVCVPYSLFRTFSFSPVSSKFGRNEECLLHVLERCSFVSRFAARCDNKATSTGSWLRATCPPVYAGQQFRVV